MPLLIYESTDNSTINESMYPWYVNSNRLFMLSIIILIILPWSSLSTFSIHPTIIHFCHKKKIWLNWWFQFKKVMEKRATLLANCLTIFPRKKKKRTNQPLFSNLMRLRDGSYDYNESLDQIMHTEGGKMELI